MNIVFIGPLPPPFTGQSLANKMAVEGLKKKGHGVYTAHKDDDVFHIEDANKQGAWSFSKFKRSLGPLFQTWKSLLTKKIDVIYLNPGLSFLGFIKYLPTLILAKIIRIPVVAHLHGGAFPSMYRNLNYLQRLLVNLALKCISEMVFLSEILKASFEDLNISMSTQICNNGVEKELFLTEINDKLKIPVSPLKILFLSNLLRSKGILDFLDALIILENRSFAFECDIAGSLEHDMEAEFYSKLKKLKSPVHFHKSVYGEKKKDLFHTSHVFCLPTYYPIEGQPISILEAYASGCAVVSTKHAGIPDIFENSCNGFYCKAQNAESIADAILKCSYDLQKIMEFNFQVSQRRFTDTAFVENIERILKNCLQTSKSKIPIPTRK